MKATSARVTRFLVLLAAMAAVPACARQDAAALPKLEIDPARVAVAGLSSGAYMATQSHLAWPELFSAAALVAGGPYGCAQGDLTRALGACMKGTPALDVDALVARARKRAHDGKTGSLAGLAGDRVYVLHGQADTTVAETVSQAAAAFYRAVSGAAGLPRPVQVTWDGERGFAHNLPRQRQGDNCTLSEPPYLGDCGFDAAGAIFAHLYGKPPRTPGHASGTLLAFDQTRFRPEGRDAYLGDTGYLYVPPACEQGRARCGLLVFFHGCKQDAGSVGQAVVRDAGFNRWADAYTVAVLYPQTRASFAPLNPKACWDWWGYSGQDYDTRQGVQQQWLRRVLTALGVPRPSP